MALKIAIDPGHGQYGNKSPNNAAYIEGTQMWKLGRKLKTALEAYGFQVFFTRPNISDDPSLAARGGMAGNNGCNMFLSLHSNAPGRNADGTYSKTCTGSVVYYSMTRPENKVLADRLGKRVSELMGHYYRGSLTREYPGRSGVDYYGVIRGAAQSGCKCAMLIEHGFHTNIQDSNWLLAEANLQKLADAEAKIIAEYFDAAKAEIEPPVTSDGQTLYRVQVGAFSVKEYADAQLKKVKAAGFDAFVTKAGNLYKVQVGAYSVKSNADAMLKKIKAKGFDAYITATSEDAAAVAPTLALGDKVKMTNGAPVYGQTRTFHSWVYNATLYVRGVNGDRITVSTLRSGAITGAVDKKYLTKI